MSERFDQLSRTLAEAPTRRGVLKMVGTAVAAATAASVLRPFRAQGFACLTPCGDRCCPTGAVCGNAATGTCVCPAGAPACGAGCCAKKETCSDPTTVCCCPAGATPCGTSCCTKGVACLDAARHLCGCPSGYTSCGTGANVTCCAAGKTCGDASCQPLSTFTSNIAKTCGSNGGGGCTLLDTVLVPSDGTVVSSAITLTNGVVYRLVASGTITVGSLLGDAEYAYDTNQVEDFCNNDPNDVDLGIYINAGPGGHTRTNPSSPPWGAYDSVDHTYTRSFTGLGAPVSFNYSDCNYGDNNPPGNLTVQIFSC